jgi:hypothetical protein
VYTPQIVIDGRKEMVGSYRAEVLGAIDAALAEPDEAISLSIKREGGLLAIGISAGQGQGRLLLVGFDSQIITAVHRGRMPAAATNSPMSTTTSALYTAAQQTADWGAPLGPGQSLTIRIYQLSALIGRGAGRSVTLTF